MQVKLVLGMWRLATRSGEFMGISDGSGLPESGQARFIEERCRSRPDSCLNNATCGGHVLNLGHFTAPLVNLHVFLPRCFAHGYPDGAL